MAQVLFRVDAGPRRGLGHLQRCLSLAAALIRRGAGVTVLAPALDDVRRRVEAAGTVIDAGGPEDTRFGGRLLSAVTALLEDGGRRAGMSLAGRRLVDGLGVERVADAMLVRG